MLARRRPCLAGKECHQTLKGLVRVLGEGGLLWAPKASFRYRNMVVMCNCGNEPSADHRRDVIWLCASRFTRHARIGISLVRPAFSCPEFAQTGWNLPKICPEKSWARQGSAPPPGKQKPRQTVDLTGFSMVGVARIELATPAMSTQCSTTELHAHGSCANSGGRGGVQAGNSLARSIL